MQWLKRNGGDAPRARSAAAVARGEAGSWTPATSPGRGCGGCGATPASELAVTETADTPNEATTKRRRKSGSGAALVATLFTGDILEQSEGAGAFSPGRM